MKEGGFNCAIVPRFIQLPKIQKHHSALIFTSETFLRPIRAIISVKDSAASTAWLRDLICAIARNLASFDVQSDFFESKDFKTARWFSVSSSFVVEWDIISALEEILELNQRRTDAQGCQRSIRRNSNSKLVGEHMEQELLA